MNVISYSFLHECYPYYTQGAMLVQDQRQRQGFGSRELGGFGSHLNAGGGRLVPPPPPPPPPHFDSPSDSSVGSGRPPHQPFLDAGSSGGFSAANRNDGKRASSALRRSRSASAGDETGRSRRVSVECSDGKRLRSRDDSEASGTVLDVPSGLPRRPDLSSKESMAKYMWRLAQMRRSKETELKLLADFLDTTLGSEDRNHGCAICNALYLLSDL